MLAPIIIGGTYACKNKKEAAASNENTTEKWVIDKESAQGANGTLFIDLPKETKWDRTIYTTGSNQVLSNTMLQKNLIYLPAIMTCRSLIS